MYRHILIAIDGSALADRALEHGLALAKEVKARVTFVIVTQLLSPIEITYATSDNNAATINQFEQIMATAAETILRAAMDKARLAGVISDVVHIADERPAEGIVAAAEKEGADLIIMASHGRRAIGRLALGSVVTEVLARSKVPTLVVR